MKYMLPGYYLNFSQIYCNFFFWLIGNNFRTLAAIFLAVRVMLRIIYKTRYVRRGEVGVSNIKCIQPGGGGSAQCRLFKELPLNRMSSLVGRK